jgi:hypothetical protein
MACGCKNKQNSAASTTAAPQRLSNPLNNGNAGVGGGRKVEKRIIR